MRFTGETMDGRGFTQPPLCPFCSAPWTENMVQLEASAAEQYSSVGPEPYGSIRIVCESCDRLIYEKEYG